jgi:membrane protein CcdC involved in cytochrome C biogenesis
MNKNHLMVGGFIITVGMISYYEIKNCHTIPWPPRIVATGIVFGMIDLFSIFSPELAGVIAVGFILAAIVNKGFNTSGDCQHSEATIAPASYDALETRPDILA